MVNSVSVVANCKSASYIINNKILNFVKIIYASQFYEKSAKIHRHRILFNCVACNGIDFSC